MNFLNSCRFCIQKVKKNERTIITSSHRSKFKDLTNTELINSEFYSEFSCYDCLQKLDSCLEVKNEFISKQDYLLNTCHQSVGGIFQDHFVDTQDFSSYPNSIESIVKIEQDEYKIISIKEETETEMLSALEFAIPEESSDEEFISRRTKNPKKKKKIPNPDLIECPYCFKLVLDLKTHKQKSHQREIAKKPSNSERKLEKLPCQFCGMLLSPLHIQEHVNKVHRQIKRYFCDYCSRSFYYRKEILRHFSVHSFSNSVQCPVCSKFYKSETNLKLHIKSMHMEKTFICNAETNGIKCGKQYDSAAKLKRHSENNHRWVKKYPCKYTSCLQSYTDVRDLEYHEYTIHLNMKIKCDLCPTLVTTKRYYKRHINLHHKELDENARKFILDKIARSDHKSLFNYQMASVGNLNQPRRKRKSYDDRYLKS